MRSRPASRSAILFEQACAARWWKEYRDELEKFRPLRNTCCHSGLLNWQQENELIQLLFAKQEFIKTLVGDAL